MEPTFPHPIFAQHFDSKDIAYAKIEEEIAKLEEGIRALRSYRNTFASTHSLPPELLSRIFSFVQSISWAKDYRGDPVSLKWISVSHVSRHWRNVALGCPSLWSTISMSFPQLILETWLKRSKHAPLSIQVDRYSEGDTELVGNHISRIRELSENSSVESWNALSCLSSPAPLLEVILIMLPFDKMSSVLSNRTFAGTAPRLRHLELHRCSVDITSTLFAPGLTHLYLENPPQKLSVTDLIITLGTLSKLSSLTLLHVLELDVGLTSPIAKVASLPSLGKLYMKGFSFTQGLDLLSYLSFPQSTLVELQFIGDVNPRPAIASLSEFLLVMKAARHQQTSTLLPPPISTSLVLKIASYTLSVYITMRHLNSEVPKRVLKADLTGSWTAPFDLADTPETSTILSALPLSSLTKFTTNCGMSVPVWTKMFGRIPHLKQIYVEGWHGHHVLSAMVHDFETHSGNPTDSNESNTVEPALATSNPQPVDLCPVFPSLKALRMTTIYLPESWPSLLPMFRARGQVGKRLNSLRILECYSPIESLVEGLRGVIKDVRWNSDEESTDDED